MNAQNRNVTQSYQPVSFPENISEPALHKNSRFQIQKCLFFGLRNWVLARSVNMYIASCNHALVFPNN